MSLKCFQLMRLHTQKLSMKNAFKQFHTSNVWFSKDIFNVQDEADFQTQVLDSKKPFLVNFYANW